MSQTFGSDHARRVLATGMTGFVGRWLAAAMKERWPSWRLYGFHRSGDGFDLPGWTPFVGDLQDGASIEAAIRATMPDIVIHLAAQSSVDSSFREAQATWNTNFGGTMRLGAACAALAPQATFFHVSTSEIYGTSFRDGPASESTCARPMNAYSRSKLAAELVLRDVLPQSARLIVVRPFNHTGPGQDRRFSMPTFAAQIAEIESGLAPAVMRVGNLESKRDFMDVRDTVRAYINIIERLEAFEMRDVVNVASGRSERMSDIVERFRARARRSFKIEIDAERLRPSDIPQASGVAERLHALTGWKPMVSMDETIDNLLDYWRHRVGAA